MLFITDVNGKTAKPIQGGTAPAFRRKTPRRETSGKIKYIGPRFKGKEMYFTLYRPDSLVDFASAARWTNRN